MLRLERVHALAFLEEELQAGLSARRAEAGIDTFSRSPCSFVQNRLSFEVMCLEAEKRIDTKDDIENDDAEGNAKKTRIKIPKYGRIVSC